MKIAKICLVISNNGTRSQSGLEPRSKCWDLCVVLVPEFVGLRMTGMTVCLSVTSLMDIGGFLILYLRVYKKDHQKMSFHPWETA